MGFQLKVIIAQVLIFFDDKRGHKLHLTFVYDLFFFKQCSKERKKERNKEKKKRRKKKKKRKEEEKILQFHQLMLLIHRSH